MTENELKILEVRLEYSESMGEARKSLELSTFLKFGELRELIALLMGVSANDTNPRMCEMS